MDRLPSEIVSYILQLTTNDDLHTALQLCLVNKAIHSMVSPFLYHQVYLSGTKQIQRFNASLKFSPKLRNLIHSITLHDHTLEYFPLEAVDAVLSAQGWINQWKMLVFNLKLLMRHHKLSCLALSREACLRFQFTNERGIQPFYKLLSKGLKKLDHLIICHTRLEFFLSIKFDAKKVTWYGCEFQLLLQALQSGKGGGSKYCSRLEEVNLMIGHNMSGCRADQVRENIESTHGRIGTPGAWIDFMRYDLDDLCLGRKRVPNVNIYLHCNTPEGRKVLEKDFKNVKYHLNFGEWGRPSDTCQSEAEVQSLINRDWELNSASEGESKHSKTEEKLISSSEHSKAAATSSRTDRFWCDCVGLGSEEIEESNEEDWYDEEADYDPSWGMSGVDSDGSWDAMTRASVLAGDSIYHSQAYLDYHGY